VYHMRLHVGLPGPFSVSMRLGTRSRAWRAGSGGGSEGDGWGLGATVLAGVVVVPVVAGGLLVGVLTCVLMDVAWWVVGVLAWFAPWREASERTWAGWAQAQRRAGAWVWTRGLLCVAPWSWLTFRAGAGAVGVEAWNRRARMWWAIVLVSCGVLFGAVLPAGSWLGTHSSLYLELRSVIDTDLVWAGPRVRVGEGGGVEVSLLYSKELTRTGEIGEVWVRLLEGAEPRVDESDRAAVGVECAQGVMDELAERRSVGLMSARPGVGAWDVGEWLGGVVAGEGRERGVIVRDVWATDDGRGVHWGDSLYNLIAQECGWRARAAKG
jgi:hypothetical protein